MENNELKISVKDAKKAYNDSDENGRKVLEQLFGKETFAPTFTKIKTFEDACSALGIDAKQWMTENETSKMDANLLAYMKLRIITEALNEGWKPKYDGKEWHYGVWYDLMTKAQYDRKSDREKEERGVLFGGSAASGALAGFVYAYALYSPSDTSASFGSRLCYKDRETALYSGKQFADIWADFLLG